MLLKAQYLGHVKWSTVYLSLIHIYIAGAHASDLIAEATFALQKGCSARDLFETIHAHPTLSEGLYEAAGMLA